MFDLICSDYYRARELGESEGPRGRYGWYFPFCHSGWYAVLIYRYGSWARRLRLPGLRHLALAAYAPLAVVQNVIFQATISIQAEIGPGFMVCRRGRVFVGPIRAGRSLYVSSDVVIAYVVRSIGDNVFFSVGSKALGPARIGNDVLVGANAVVTFDVPDNCTVLPPQSRIARNDLFSANTEASPTVRTVAR